MATAVEVSLKEGSKLLGEPTFEKLENGRFKCVETGHEMPIHAKDSYANSKRCRLGLIDFALVNKKPPLNMFKQDPISRSKVICKLTCDTVNKSEEHIWKHINGRRFLNKLEQMEAGTLGKDDNKKVEEKSETMEVEGGSEGKEDGSKKKNKKKKKKKKAKTKEEIVTEVRELPDDSDSDEEVEEEDEELDFWMPPVGERWDFDDGKDRWGSDDDSGDEEDNQEDNGVDDTAIEEKENASELSNRTKRMSIEIGPSSFASRKKKSKSTC